MYWHCENCNCYRQEDGEKYPRCHCENDIRPCEKDSETEYIED